MSSLLAAASPGSPGFHSCPLPGHSTQSSRNYQSSGRCKADAVIPLATPFDRFLLFPENPVPRRPEPVGRVLSDMVPAHFSATPQATSSFLPTLCHIGFVRSQNTSHSFPTRKLDLKPPSSPLAQLAPVHRSGFGVNVTSMQCSVAFSVHSVCS